MRFADIISRVQSRIATDDSNTLTIIKQEINDIQRDIEVRLPEAYWTRAEAQITTLAKITTGTCDVVKGSNVVDDFTLGGTSIKSTLRGAYWQNTADSRTWYKIKRWTDGDTVEIDHPYIGTTADAVSYQIYKAEYELPGDFKSLRGLVNETYPTRLWALSQRDLQRSVPDLLNDGAFGDPLYWWFTDITTEANYLETDGGDPGVAVSANSVGTIDILTQGSRVVTGLNTAWTTAGLVLPGQTFKLTREDEEYMIERVASATSLILGQPYRGASASTGAGLTYQIDPPGKQNIGLYPIPDTQKNLKLFYHRRLPTLVADDDQSVIPEQFHIALVRGAEARMLQHVGQNEEAASAEQQYMQFVLGEMKEVGRKRDSDYIPQLESRPDYLGYGGPRLRLPGNFEQWSP